MRLESRRAAALAHGGVVARAVGLVDERERVVAELREGYRAAPGERMVVADAQHGALVEQVLLHDAVAGLRAVAERDLELASGDQPHEHAGVVLAGDDAHVRARLRQPGEEPLREVVGARGEPESQLPRAPPACSRATASSASVAATAARAWGSTSLPAADSATERDVRSSSVTPSCPSKRWICWLSVGWVMCSRAAARPKWSVSAAATNERSSRGSTFMHRAY